MGVCNCSMFFCMLLYVHSSIAIILMGKRELDALLNLSSWCLVMVERLFLAMPRGCLRCVIVVFPDLSHYSCQLGKIYASLLELLYEGYIEDLTYMSNHVLLNLLNDLGKRDKMRGLASIYLFSQRV